MPIIRDYINPKELPETADAVIRVTPSGLAEAKIYGENKFSDKDHAKVIQKVVDEINNFSVVFLFGHFRCNYSIIIPKNKSIIFVNGILEYVDSEKKPFIIFEGGNQNSYLINVTIGGRNASPALLINDLSYQSLINIINCYVGFKYGFDNSFKSYWGCIVKSCDVLKVYGSHFYGRDIALRLGGGQDHYLVNVHVSVLPEGLPDETHKIALWRNTIADELCDLAQGTLYYCVGSYNAPKSIALKLRSLNFLSNVYGERAKRIIDAEVAEVIADECSFKQIDEDEPDYTFYFNNVAYGVIKKCRIESAPSATAMIYLINQPSGAEIIFEDNDVFTKPSTLFGGPDVWSLKIKYNRGMLGVNGGLASFIGDGTTTQFKIAHGLVSVPKVVVVTPKGSTPKPDSIDWDDTYIYINYSTAPASGTSLIFSWYAEC